MNNNFAASWADFFVEQRLRPHLTAINEYFPEKSVDLARLADDVCCKTHEVLDRLGDVRPSILHGNLCTGNAGGLQRADDVVTPFVFDPTSFYGYRHSSGSSEIVPRGIHTRNHVTHRHSEFDLAYHEWPVKDSFNGLSDSFLKGYHEVLPRANGHEEREEIYQFLHILEHICSGGETYIPLAYQYARSILS